MSKTMKAFVMKKIGEAGIIEKPVPTDPGPNDAIIKTTAALVCFSDLNTIKGACGDRTDLTLGHEACGIVHQVGSAVTFVKPGDRIAAAAITPCYRCNNCQRGFSSQCKEFLGSWEYSTIKDGNFAEYFHVNDADTNLALIPDGVSDEAACYATSIMSEGFQGAEDADIILGSSAVVFGLNPVGQMAIAGARLLGAGLIIAVDNAPKRLELSKEYGADVLINFNETDVVKEILRLTNGDGVDSVMETMGTQASFENCIKVTRPGGTIANIGYHREGEYLKIPRLEWGAGLAEKNIKTSLCTGGSDRMSRLLRLIQTDRVDPTKMTSHHFKFDEMEKVFWMMENKKHNMFKPLITFTNQPPI